MKPATQVPPFSVLISACGAAAGGHRYIWTIIENGQPAAHSLIDYLTFEEATRSAKAKLDGLVADWQRYH